jgi:predicted RNase H-like nuclease
MAGGGGGDKNDRGATRKQLPYTMIGSTVMCPAGWLVIAARIVGVTVVVEDPVTFPTFGDVLDYRPAFTVIALGAPVGFPDIPTGGYRPAEKEARTRLPFNLRVTIPRVPCRDALYAPTLDEAVQVESWVTAAEYRRFRRWREIDRAIQNFHQRTVFSTVPELSYGQLTPIESPLKSTPSSPEGQAERLELVEQRIPGVTAKVRECALPGVDIRHLVEAAGMLWSARRISGRILTRFPSVAEWNEDGLRIEVVC